jgi:hypothetical protein
MTRVMRTLFVTVVLVVLAACGGGSPPQQSTSPTGSGGPGGGGGGSTTPTYDVDALGIPKLVTTDYIDLASIERISHFRSSIGHDYADDFETCRSMKHYFQPRASVDWSTVAIFSPVQGTIDLTRDDFAGKQIVIRAQSQPAFTFVIFHVNPSISIANGTPLTAGQPLGTHIGSVTMSDIAVWVQTPAGRKLLSWFDVMTDGLFQAYAARGITSRQSAVITRAERDADPLTCSGETFTSLGTIANWLQLF